MAISTGNAAKKRSHGGLTAEEVERDWKGRRLIKYFQDKPFEGA